MLPSQFRIDTDSDTDILFLIPIQARGVIRLPWKKVSAVFLASTRYLPLRHNLGMQNQTWTEISDTQPHMSRAYGTLKTRMPNRWAQGYLCARVVTFPTRLWDVPGNVKALEAFDLGIVLSHSHIYVVSAYIEPSRDIFFHYSLP